MSMYFKARGISLLIHLSKCAVGILNHDLKVIL